MPTYEYRCKDCGDELEAVQAFTDDPLTECPSCGGTLKKKFGSVGISFKGSGFYKNDSRATSGAGNGSKAGDSTKSESAASDSGSSDGTSSAKPAESSPASKSDGGTPSGGKSPSGGKNKETAST